MRLTRRALNRTLLHRQRLLARVAADPLDLVGHLVGLQAQETLPPYLSLHARLPDFDPRPVSAAVADRRLVRMVVMRGTIHLLRADDAVWLRQFTQPVSDRERAASQNTRAALHLDTDEVAAAIEVALSDGPLAFKELGEALAERFPGTPSAALAHRARVDQPLVQLPPRGRWRQSGGVVVQRVDRWLGRELEPPDVEELVRRYLRAFGPASAADVTTWSGVTRLGPVLRAMTDLDRHTGPDGKPLYDVPGGEIVQDADAPVRLLGTYDNVWLSHAGRDRVTEPDKRRGWMGPNGGLAQALFVDGWLEGLWRVRDGRPEVVAEFRTFTRAERAQLQDELGAVKALLAVPAEP